MRNISPTKRHSRLISNVIELGELNKNMPFMESPPSQVEHSAFIGRGLKIRGIRKSDEKIDISSIIFQFSVVSPAFQNVSTVCQSYEFSEN